jgi:hypothetical protein
MGTNTVVMLSRGQVREDAATAGVASGPVSLSDHPGFQCCDLDEELAEALIARTLDPADVRLREMTRDLNRFSSMGQLAQWRPGRDLLCLRTIAEGLLGVFWVVDKPLPERNDYFEPDVLLERAPSLTCAIRTYGAARGRGLLTKAFAECALEELLRRRGGSPSVWYQTKAENHEARALGRQMGFFEASGEEDGTVIGVRFLHGGLSGIDQRSR